MRSVLAGVLFVGMMTWTAWLLLASVWAEAENRNETIVETVTWYGKTVITEGPAFQGPWRMNDSQFYFVDDPSVDVDEDGSVALVWVDQSDKNIFFTWHDEDGGIDTEDAVNVSSSPDIFSWLPRVVISPVNRDHIFVLWQEIIFSGGSHGGEILFARSTDRGRSFSEPVNLSNTPAGAGKGRLTFLRWDNGSLDLAVGPDGKIYAAWTEYEGALRISLSTDDGLSFSNPMTVAGDDEAPARGPSLAVDSEGFIHLAWTVGEDKAGDIYYTRSTDDGQSASSLRFEEPQVVVETDGHSDAPKIAVDSNCTLHMVHAESPDGLFQRYHIYYSQFVFGGSRNSDDSLQHGMQRNDDDSQQDNLQRNSGDITEKPQDRLTASGRGTEFVRDSELVHISKPVRISEPHPGRFESANFPELALDDADQIYVIWELFSDYRNRSQGLGFTTSLDKGLTFSNPSQIPGTGDPDEGHNGSRQGLLMNKLAVSSSGDISVVNSTFLEGESSTIRLIRGYAKAD